MAFVKCSQVTVDVGAANPAQLDQRAAEITPGMLDVIRRSGRHEIGAGDHRQHAGRVPGGGNVDRADRGVGMRRAHEGGTGEIVELEIVDIGAGTGDETLVLSPPGRIADH